MLVAPSATFRDRWLPDALDDVAERGRLLEALDSAADRLRRDPLAGEFAGFQTETVYRRLDVGYATMQLLYQVDPVSLEVTLRAIGRPDEIARVTPGSRVPDPGLDRAVEAIQRAASGGDEIQWAHSRAVLYKELRLAGSDIPASVRAARSIEVLAVAQGNAMELALQHPTISTTRVEALVLSAGDRRAVRHTSELARVVAGRRRKDWSVEEALGSLESRHPELHRAAMARALERAPQIEQSISRWER